MITLFHSNPSTGEIYETKDVRTVEEKEFAMTKAGGDWWETPRWQRNPKPKGVDPTNPYEAAVLTPYEEYPRVLYKFKAFRTDAVTKEQTPTFEQKIVKSEDEKAAALKAGWTLGATTTEKPKEMTAA